MDKDALLNGAPWTDDARITWFNTTDLLLFLKTRRNNASVQRVWSAIRRCTSEPISLETDHGLIEVSKEDRNMTIILRRKLLLMGLW